ncbi:MAG: hypothetical protein A2X08_14070 [Bacteroidetes bacterium GWA2_32_17]|nr:MAG: hypothetical protein A2X08_14070 [Bacteroidetes bacterium GWA2_32_17]
MRITSIKSISFILIFLLTFSLSCNISSFSGKLDEGSIEYDIVYLQNEKDNPLISLLPTTMTLKFKDEKSIQKIEGWMGIFQMSGIADRDNNSRQATLKIMNEKYFFQTTMTGPDFGFDSMPDFKLISSDSTKTIAGYLCKRYDVYINDTAKFSIYYTDQIELKNPNCNNPFKQVDGMLLEFQMSFQKIPMHLIAKKITKEEINNDEFNVPEGFVKVPKEKMQETIQNLM